MGQRYLISHIRYPEANFVVKRPAWSGDLQNTHVVNGFVLGIEFWVFEYASQLSRSNGVLIGCGVPVNSIANKGQLALCVQLSISRLGNISDLFVSLADSIDPAFYDLDAI